MIGLSKVEFPEKYSRLWNTLSQMYFYTQISLLVVMFVFLERVVIGLLDMVW